MLVREKAEEEERKRLLDLEKKARDAAAAAAGGGAGSSLAEPAAMADAGSVTAEEVRSTKAQPH